MQKTLSPQLPLSYLLDLQLKHWLHKNRISTSINFSMCKKLMVNSHFNIKEFKAYIDQINSFVASTLATPSMKILVGSWLNTIIFNIAALNDEYKEELSHSLSSSCNESHDVSIEIIDSLHQCERESLSYLLEMTSLNQIIEQVNPSTKLSSSHKSQHQMEYTLLSTIHYLCQKMKINPKCQEIIHQKLEILNECQCQCGDKEIEEGMRSRVNGIIFGNFQSSSYDVLALENSLKSNFNANLLSIVSLIDSNYYQYQTTRPIFNNCLLTGAQVIQQIVRKIIKNSNKNDLFSEKMVEVDRLFQLLLTIIEYRHLSLYVTWCRVLMDHLTNKTRERDQGIFKSLCQFLYVLPIQHWEFAELLKFIANELIKNKYAENIMVDLVKKFVLNRFLLNPVLFYTYASLQISQENLSAEINKIRLLFYPKKCPGTRSQKIESILTSLLNEPSPNFSKLNPLTTQTKTVVYHLDRSLRTDYETIYSDLFSKQPESSLSIKSPSNPNSSYQISFSFVKNNISKQEIRHSGRKQQKSVKMHTPKTNINIPQQNYSINNILREMSEKDNHDLGSPTSQKSRKTVYTEHTDLPPTVDTEIGMIQQLVARRRALGATRRVIDERKNKKRQQREKLQHYYSKVHGDFQVLMREIQKDASLVRLEIEIL